MITAEARPLPAVLSDVARAAADLAGMAAPGGEGLCLPVTAAVCHVLAEAGIPDVHAVQGGYECEPHWWMRVGDRILDATRAQFDAGPLVCPVGSEGYFTETEYPPGWTEAHVVMEAQRAFYFRGTGALFAETLLGVLRLAVADRIPRGQLPVGSQNLPVLVPPGRGGGAGRWTPDAQS